MATWLDQILEANARYAADSRPPGQPAAPSRKLAVLACMDTRHIVEHALGLAPGDAAVIRVAGPLADGGVIRSLRVAQHVLGVERVLVMGHTDCGMKRASEFPGLADKVEGFTDAAANVAQAIDRIRHEFSDAPFDVAGLLYDNATGAVTVLSAAQTR